MVGVVGVEFEPPHADAPASRQTSGTANREVIMTRKSRQSGRGAAITELTGTSAGHFPVKAPHERLLAETPRVALGTFSCVPSDPRFADTGPSSTYCFAFPRVPVWIAHEDGEPILCGPAVATLYNERQRYTRRAVTPRGDEADWCAVDPALLDSAIDAAGLPASRGTRRLFTASHVRTDTSTFVRQRRLFDRLMHGEDVGALELEETVLLLLSSLLDAVPRGSRSEASAVNTRGRRLVAEVKRLLAEQPERSLTLDGIASALGCSVFHLCRTFRRLEGATIHASLVDLRLRLALERLRADPTADITAIALQFGFSSHSHFTAAFRRAFGTTPSKWRDATP